MSAAPPSYAPAPQPAAAPRSQYTPPQQAAQPPLNDAETPAQIQASIARIHEACQAPPLSPPDYRSLFEAMADEITPHVIMMRAIHRRAPTR